MKTLRKLYSSTLVKRVVNFDLREIKFVNGTVKLSKEEVPLLKYRSVK